MSHMLGLNLAISASVLDDFELLAAVCTLLNETRALEHGDVFLHGGEAHRVARCSVMIYGARMQTSQHHSATKEDA